MRDIAHLSIDGDRVEIETLFGEHEVIRGRLKEVDFMKSRVVIEETAGA